MGIPDAVYYDVFDYEGSKMSALHAAVFMMEYHPGSICSVSPLRSIVQRKYDPDYLNLAISEGVYRGYTAMHIAVKTCNEEAVRCLLDEEGDSLDMTLVDHGGSSLIDLASELFRNQASNMEFWEISQEKRNGADERHFENTMMILHMLYNTKRAMPRKILATVTRIEADGLFIILFEEELFKVLKVKPSVFDGLSPEQITRVGAWYSLQARWDLTIIWHQIAEKGPRLPLNDSFFLLRSDEMSADELEYASSKGSVIHRERFQDDLNGESELVNAMYNL